jgi:hypothetical protein
LVKITHKFTIDVRSCDHGPAEVIGMAKTQRGEKMTKTGRWILTPKKGREREFSGTLLKTFNFGKNRLAIFSVAKRFS